MMKAFVLLMKGERLGEDTLAAPNGGGNWVANLLFPAESEARDFMRDQEFDPEAWEIVEVQVSIVRVV